MKSTVNWKKSKRKVAEDKKRAAMFFCTNREKVATRQKEESAKRKKKNEIRKKKADKETKKRVEAQKKIEEDRRECALQMEQLEWERNLNLEIAEKRMNGGTDASSSTREPNLMLVEFLTTDPNSNLSNWWSRGQLECLTQPDQAGSNVSERCYYCKRFNCIGFSHYTGSLVEKDPFKAFEDEMLQKRGHAIDKKEIRAHLTTRFRVTTK